MSDYFNHTNKREVNKAFAVFKWKIIFIEKEKTQNQT